MAGEWMNGVAEYLLDFVNYGIGIIVILIIYQAWKFITFSSEGDEATLGDAAEKIKTFKKDYGKLRRALKREYQFDKKQLNLYADLEKAINSSDKKKAEKALESIEKLGEEEEKFNAFIVDVLDGAPSGPKRIQLETLKNIFINQLSNKLPSVLKGVADEIIVSNWPSAKANLPALKTVLAKIQTTILGIEALVDQIKEQKGA